MTRHGRMGVASRRPYWASFLRMRRESVVVSTKFGILPAQTSFLKEMAKPLARKVLQMVPSARKAVQRQIGAQFSANNFTVKGVTRECRDESAKAGDGLRGSVVHELGSAERAPAGGPVCRDADDGGLGKVRLGISAEPEVVEVVALGPNPEVLRCFQFPCNLFDLGMRRGLRAVGVTCLAESCGSPRVRPCCCAGKDDGTSPALR
jgi:hypothetical protein